MAGGVGSRFWPISTQHTPKQFLDILNTGRSLLQGSYDRVKHIVPAQNILVVTNSEYAKLVADQLPELPQENILLEPVRRNTAPCIAYAAFKIAQRNPEATMVVTPSDHLITNEVAYIETLEKALAISGAYPYLLTLGITPSRPETGYGYIQFKESVLAEDDRLKKVKTFTEKPDIEHAKAFLDSGDFLWNSGVFIWSAKACLDGFKKYLPDVYDTFNEGLDKYDNDAESDFINTIYPQCENISIDYGLMEKANNVYVLPADFGWSDLGTWSSVHDQLKHDKQGNGTIGKRVMLLNSTDTLVVSSGKKVIVADSLNGYVIAEGEQAILIYPKEKEQEVKGIVSDVRLKWGEDFV